MRAALCVNGRVVMGNSHIDCFMKLSEAEKDGDLLSGFYDQESQQFISDTEARVLRDKELYLVRHGHYADYDAPDPDIDDEGIDQVHETARLLSTRNIGTFVGVTSPMLRCLRTAAILHNELGIQFQVIPETMETPSFLNEGEIFKLKNRSRQFPQFRWPTSKEWHVHPETGSDFLDRVKETLQVIPARSIVVTHFGYICLTAKIALCKKLFTESFPPASVTYFNRTDGERLGWNDDEVSQDRPATLDRKAG